MKCYLAAPFFTPSQVDTLDKVEAMLDCLHLDYYSPRKDGVLNDMSPSDRQASLKRIFDLNVTNMVNCNIMLANIDGESCTRDFDNRKVVDRDQGTSWELGFFYGYFMNKFYGPPKIITYSAHGHGSNVMVSQSTLLHIPNLTKLRLFLEDLENPDRGLEYILENKSLYSEEMETTE